MIYVFDICDTLFYSNTTYEFILYVLEKEQKHASYKKLQDLLSKKRPLFYLTLLKGKLHNKDLFKTTAIKALKGFCQEKLFAHAKSFFKERLLGKQIPEPHAILAKAIKDQNKVLLISSTIDPIAKVIANNYHADVISSKLEIIDGICTGRIAEEVKGKKHLLFKERSGASKYTVVTDNYSDLELVNKAAVKYVVLHKPAHKERWLKTSPNFIYCYK